MKISSLLAALAGLLCVAPAVGRAQQTGSSNYVSTTGIAEVKVVPDRADLTFNVEVRNADLATACHEQAERSNRVLTALRAGASAEEIRAAQIVISTNYTDRDAETAQPKFYQVTQEFSCTLRDVTQVPTLTMAVVTAGVTGVRPAVLRTLDLSKHKDEARRQAIRAARDKAVVLATELGRKVGSPATITESPNGTRTTYGYFGGGTTPATDVEGTQAAFASGTITVSASVGVSFVLE